MRARQDSELLDSFLKSDDGTELIQAKLTLF